jgi:hypothetical protein
MKRSLCRFQRAQNNISVGPQSLLNIYFVDNRFFLNNLEWRKQKVDTAAVETFLNLNQNMIAIEILVITLIVCLLSVDIYATLQKLFTRKEAADEPSRDMVRETKARANCDADFDDLHRVLSLIVNQMMIDDEYTSITRVLQDVEAGNHSRSVCLKIRAVLLRLVSHMDEYLTEQESTHKQLSNIEEKLEMRAITPPSTPDILK